MPSQPRRAGLVSKIAALGLAIAALASTSVLAQRTPLRVASTPEPSGRTITVSKELLQREREAAARGGPGRNVSVIVRFEGESLSSYRGSIAGMGATAPQATGEARVNPRSANSQRYLSYLNSRHEVFASQLRGSVPSARVAHSFRAVMNGMAVVVPESRISALAALPGVAAVYEDKLLQPTTDASPAFIGAPALWNKLGGQASAGEGVIIGVLDSGIWPEHPSLQDPDPSGKPYAAPPAGARACEFGIGTRPGPAFSCNNKLIGAKRSMATYDAVVGLLPTEYTSARDDDGHGTHTATTAGGNRNVAASIRGASLGTVTGIAPRAHVMVYKVCGDQGCFSSDSVAAVNQAILDGVDVINFSISGGSSPYSDPVSLAFLDAYEAGIFVAASAGNSGPGANTVDHREPWTTTVAASTSNRQFQSTLTLNGSTGSLTLLGASITPALSTPAPVVVTADSFCLSPFAAGTVAGKVVVCQRGVNARVEKSFNASQGGAVGMILYDPTPLGVATDNHFIPSVHLSSTAGAQLNTFLAANPGGVTATLSAGTATAAQGDVMAAFSSRGGSGTALGVSKPDVTAPGVQILAGNTPTPATQAGGVPGQLFQAIQGTSMSSPHVAGAAALLKALHPSWTPGQIKSALMTTATANVRKEDGNTLADPFDMGSGRIDLAKAGDPGLLFDEAGANFVAKQSSLWETNYPSLYIPNFLGQALVGRTLQNTRNTSAIWKVRVTTPSDLKVVVPGLLAVAARGSARLPIAIDGSGVPVGGVRHAVIEFQRSNEATLRFPITVVRGTAPVPLTKTCTPTDIALNSNTQCTITMANTTFDPANVTLLDLLPSRLQLVSGSVVNATQLGNSLAFSGTLAGAQPAGVAIGAGLSPGGGYVPLSGFGIAPIGGVGDETITNFNVPAFTYAGESYTRVGIVSNGYLVVGGGTSADVNFVNQSLPSAAAPNNVLAPFWTDLDPGLGGAVRIATLTDGVNTWLVVEFENVKEFSSTRTASFQVWIGLSGTQDVSFAYGTVQGNGDGGLLTVGAENRFGNRGQNYYFNGAGTLPAAGTQLVVTSTPGAPGGSRTITFSAKGRSLGPWTDCAQMTSNAYFGAQTACVSGTVR